MKKFAIGAFALLALFSLPAFSAEGARAARLNSYADDGGAALGAAYNAYAASDWQSAAMLFRKALSDPQNESDSSLYMLIMAEMNAKSFRAACSDARYFLQNYSDSRYAPLIKYQEGRSLFNMAEYDKAVLSLSDFCHEHPESPMYPSALFWIAECFYSGYNFEEARPLYERVVEDFPHDPKAIDAKYRLDAIDQRLREEKLLHLLQQTGESYLSSKENYEKALRRYELEAALGISAQELPDETPFAEGARDEAQNSGQGAEENGSLADGKKVPGRSAQSPILTSDNAGDYNFIDALARLKKSAAEAQGLLDQKEEDE